MLSLIMFAIIGALINAPGYFWGIYAAACAVWVIDVIIKVIKAIAEKL